jgi:hypothetical protein
MAPTPERGLFRRSNGVTLSKIDGYRIESAAAQKGMERRDDCRFFQGEPHAKQIDVELG